jgi:hypothetical protein
MDDDNDIPFSSRETSSEIIIGSGSFERRATELP